MFEKGKILSSKKKKVKTHWKRHLKSKKKRIQKIGQNLLQ
jgi:hypothetical protein